MGLVDSFHQEGLIFEYALESEVQTFPQRLEHEESQVDLEVPAELIVDEGTVHSDLY